MTPAARIDATVAEWAGRLVDLSRALHADPELSFAEHRAVDRLARILGEAGFAVRPGAYGLPTALRATAGDGPFRVGVCAEYDALPELGHACGHNVIAASSVGAALALAAVADGLGLTVVLLGTPAEEAGGGKVRMLERGAFDDLVLAVMAHPAPIDIDPAGTSSQAVSRATVSYAGTAAHASAVPWLGVNAADAAVVAQVALGQLRQQVLPTSRIAAIVRHGGDRTNVIPDRTEVEVELRTGTTGELAELRQRVLRCFEAGAVASGCTMRVDTPQPDYAHLVQDRLLARRWVANLAELGRAATVLRGPAAGSTDMGNVTHHVPGLHPSIGILGAANAPHSAGFAADCASSAADEAVVVAAAALARTVADVAADPRARAHYLDRLATRSPYGTRPA